MYDSIIFDMDGTLWDSTDKVAIAYKKVLEKHPEITDEVTTDKIKGLFGLPLDEIGVRLFKSVPPEHARKVIKECCEYENEYLALTGVDVYEGLEETLKKLHKKFKLFIVSNCQDGYIECFFKIHPQLKQYFTDYEYYERNHLSKAENIRLIVNRYKLAGPVYVGDIEGDLRAAREAGVPFIWASYGFGSVTDCDMSIASIKELPGLLL
jgi:phosphoglycolate phosphatase